MLASMIETRGRFGRAARLAQDHAQHVGLAGKIVAARAVAGAGDLHRGQHAELAGERGGDGGAGGRGEFHRGPARVDGPALDQRRCRRRRHRQHAVLRFHRPAAHVERRAGYASPPPGYPAPRRRPRCRRSNPPRRLRGSVLFRSPRRAPRPPPRPGAGRWRWRWPPRAREVPRSQSAAGCAKDGGGGAASPPPRGTWWRRCRSAVPSRTRARRRCPGARRRR